MTQASLFETGAGENRAKPKPFVKWAGGKRQLLRELKKHVPRDMRRYHEPFVGGAALFFDLFGTSHGRARSSAVLSDKNERLVRTYRAVRHSPEVVIARLRCYPNTRDFFLHMRDEKDPEKLDDAELAAWFIYLNKTCFNGLYRVNRSDRFNVPFGDHKAPVICDAENLLACSAALNRSGACIEHEDFREALGRGSVEEDFFYFDPPYVPRSPTASFKSYQPGGFSSKDQADLRDVARELVRRGAFVLLSNSDTEEARALYGGEPFVCHGVRARRPINSKAGARGLVSELLIVGRR